jgi:PAS domain S-box-containing protein
MASSSPSLVIRTFRVFPRQKVHEPVIGRDGPLGVLVVMWKAAIAHTSAPVISEVGLLATEAAAAIERADLIARLSAQTAAEQLRLRQLLEGAPEAIIISDSAGVIQTVNEQTLRLLGYAREELIGGSVDQLVTDGLRGGHARHRDSFVAQANAGPISLQRDLTARHKDGSEIPVEFTLAPVHTDEGLLVMAALRDITDRRAAEAALRAAEEQFRRSFDDAPIGMTVVDLEGRYLEVNDAFRAIVGHPGTRWSACRTRRSPTRRSRPGRPISARAPDRNGEILRPGEAVHHRRRTRRLGFAHRHRDPRGSGRAHPFHQPGPRHYRAPRI